MDASFTCHDCGQDFIPKGILAFFCPACQDIRDEYETRHRVTLLPTSEWIKNIGGPSDPSIFTIRVAHLLRTSFPFLPDSNWKIVSGEYDMSKRDWSNYRMYQEVAFAIKLSDILSVTLRIANSGAVLGTVIKNYQSVLRTALRGSEWYDILGWVSQAREIIDGDVRNFQVFHVACEFQFGGLHFNPLEEVHVASGLSLIRKAGEMWMMVSEATTLSLIGSKIVLDRQTAENISNEGKTDILFRTP